MRHPTEVTSMSTYKVSVNPKFPKQATADHKLDFEIKMRLHCHYATSSGVEWVTAPQWVVMASSGKTFNIEVDPTELAEG